MVAGVVGEEDIVAVELVAVGKVGEWVLGFLWMVANKSVGPRVRE